MIRSPARNHVPSDKVTARSRRSIWMRKMQRGLQVYSLTDARLRNQPSSAKTAKASPRKLLGATIGRSLIGGPVGHQGIQTADQPWRSATARKRVTELGGSPARRRPAIRVGRPSAALNDPRPRLRGSTTLNLRRANRCRATNHECLHALGENQEDRAAPLWPRRKPVWVRVRRFGN
jgi:hypothetical protein